MHTFIIAHLFHPGLRRDLICHIHVPLRRDVPEYADCHDGWLVRPQYKISFAIRLYKS